VRDSLSLLDQAIAHGGGKVTAVQVAEMLGSLGGDLMWPLLECVAAGDGAGTVREAERIASRSISLDSALEEIAAILHRVALAQAGVEPPAEDPDAPRIAALAARLDSGRVQVMYQIAVLGRRDLPLAPDELAGFTMALLRMLSFTQAQAGERAERPAATAKQAAAKIARSAEPAPASPAPAPPRANPSAAAAPAASAAAPAAGASMSFDGDWPALVERLGLTGMAGMVARYGELASWANNHLELVVPESHRMYAERAYVDKLKEALVPHFGANLRITVRAGGTAGTSVAAQKSKVDAQRQADAAGAIEDDPFVRDLVRDLGAEVVPSSIRPHDEGAPGNPTGDKR